MATIAMMTTTKMMARTVFDFPLEPFGGFWLPPPLLDEGRASVGGGGASLYRKERCANVSFAIITTVTSLVDTESIHNVQELKGRETYYALKRTVATSLSFVSQMHNRILILKCDGLHSYFEFKFSNVICFIS